MDGLDGQLTRLRRCAHGRDRAGLRRQMQRRQGQLTAARAGRGAGLWRCCRRRPAEPGAGQASRAEVTGSRPTVLPGFVAAVSTSGRLSPATPYSPPSASTTRKARISRFANWRPLACLALRAVTRSLPRTRARTRAAARPSAVGVLLVAEPPPVAVLGRLPGAAPAWILPAVATARVRPHRLTMRRAARPTASRRRPAGGAGRRSSPPAAPSARATPASPPFRTAGRCGPSPRAYRSSLAGDRSASRSSWLTQSLPSRSGSLGPAPAGGTGQRVAAAVVAKRGGRTSRLTLPCVTVARTRACLPPGSAPPGGAAVPAVPGLQVGPAVRARVCAPLRLLVWPRPEGELGLVGLVAAGAPPDPVGVVPLRPMAIRAVMVQAVWIPAAMSRPSRSR